MQIAWQTNGGLGTTSPGFAGDLPRADGQRRRYTFRASVNPQIQDPRRSSGSSTCMATATTSTATTPSASPRTPTGSRPRLPSTSGSRTGASRDETEYLDKDLADSG